MWCLFKIALFLFLAMYSVIYTILWLEGVTISAEDALIEVDQWDLSELENDKNEFDPTMDKGIFDDSDSGPLDTDIESSGSNDTDFPHRPFTVQNSGVHFLSQPESELEAL